MNYLSHEDQTNLFKQQIKYYELAIDGIKPVKEIIKQFDGKVINKRLHDKLPENYRLAKDGIVFYSQLDRSIKSATKDTTGYSCSNYIFYDTVNFTNYTGFEGGHEIIFKDGSKRLDAAKLIELIDLNVDRIKKQIQSMAEALKHIAEWEETKQSILDQIEAYNNMIEYSTRCYFNLTIETRR